MIYNIPIRKLIHKILSIKYNKYSKINFTETIFFFTKERFKRLNKNFFSFKLIFLFYSNTIIFPFNVTIFTLTNKENNSTRISHHDRLQVTPVCQDSHKRLYVKRKTRAKRKKGEEKDLSVRKGRSRRISVSM